MSITQENKKSLMDEYKISPKDTGSAPIQISILSKRVENLLGHFKKNPKDHASRLGLLKMVGHRRRLLKYLNKVDHQLYQNVIQKLDLRK